MLIQMKQSDKIYTNGFEEHLCWDNWNLKQKECLIISCKEKYNMIIQIRNVS